MVEQPAVNRRVAGSSPASGATIPTENVLGLHSAECILNAVADTQPPFGLNPILANQPGLDDLS